MRKLILIFVTLFLYSFVQAANGVIKGIAMDSVASSSMPSATVMLKKMPDEQLVKSLLTNDDGSFEFSSLSFGEYKIYFNFVGYETVVKSVTLSAELPLVDIGTVNMQESSSELDPIVVAAEASSFTMQADKKIFDVSKIESAAGGSAADVLRQIPMVEMDGDDNLQMRGKPITITVDGRPSPYPDVQTTMQMLPADVIEKIEVITNPSARYQSEGAGGIINIVLKKNKVRGYNGAVSLSYAPDAQLRVGATLNYRRGKLNLFATANYRQNKRISDGLSERKNLRSDTIYEYVNQPTHSENKSPLGLFKFGFDYFFNDKDAVTVSELINLGSSHGDEAINMSYKYAPTMREYRKGVRNNTADNQDKSYVTEVNYKHTFNQKVEHEFTSDLRYTYDEYDRNTSYQTDMERLNLIVDTFYHELPKWQTKTGGINRNKFLLKADYVHPIGKAGKFEAGVSADGQWNKTKYDAEKLVGGNLINALFIPDPSQTEDYKFIEQLYAAYFDYANTLGNVGYKLGFRAEQSFMDGTSILKDTMMAKVNTPYFYIFPSAFLTYNLGDDQRLVASYSARITRPSFLQLVPYSDVSNLQNIRLGSPDLKPSYTHSFELSYSHFFKKSQNMLSLEGYYSRTNDVIQRMRFMDDVRNYVPGADKDSVTVSKLENVGRSDVAGANFILRLRPVKNLTIATTVSGNYSVMQGIRNGESYKSDLFSARANLNATFVFPQKIIFGLSGRYTLPTLTAQGNYQEYGAVDLSLRRSFFKKMLTATVALYDAFNTVKYVNNAVGDGFESHSERWGNTRQLRFTVMYKFGKIDTESLDRRSKQSVELTPEDAPKGRGL